MGTGRPGRHGVARQLQWVPADLGGMGSRGRGRARPARGEGGYGAGRCLDYTQTEPECLARAIADEAGRPVRYRPVEIDGAARAAASLAELI